MKVIFPTDLHIPFQDDKAIDLAMKIGEDFEPDLRITGSDAMDFYGISVFDRDPVKMKAGSFDEEIEKFKATERGWQTATPKAESWFIPGNHEDRLRRWVWGHSEIYTRALSIEELLDFKGLNIHWGGRDTRTEEIVLHGKLVIKHGSFVRKDSGMSARAEMEHERYSISTLSGHTHRGGQVFFRTRRGVVQSVEGFCLCRLNPEYIAHPNWQQGIVLAEVTEDFLSIELVPFSDVGNSKVARFRGKEFRA